MQKWNKKIGLVFLNLGLLMMTPNPANAADCGKSCDPCDPCAKSCSNWCGEIDVGVDFLYWKPCVDDLTYATVVYDAVAEGTAPVVTKTKYKYKNLCTGWEPGFRIRVGKDDVWCGMRLDASYTWLEIEDSHRILDVCELTHIESPLLHPEFAPAGVGTTDPYFQAVKAKYDTHYQTWDVLLSFDCCCNNCGRFSPFFGVEGLTFNQELKVDLFVEDTGCGTDLMRTIDWRNDYFGVGLKVGADYTYQLCDGFSLFARASGSILTGNSDNKFNRNIQEQYDADSSDITRWCFDNPGCCQFVPGYHLQLGLNYISEMCGCETDLRFGWEYVVWHNISNPNRFFSDTAGQTTAGIPLNTTTIGFQGFLVGADFSF